LRARLVSASAPRRATPRTGSFVTTLETYLRAAFGGIGAGLVGIYLIIWPIATSRSTWPRASWSASLTRTREVADA
jgi:hypothetical protein